MRRALFATALIAVSSLALSACGSDSTNDGGRSQSSTTSNGGSGDRTEFAFGDTYNGPLKTTVQQPEKFTTSEFAQPKGNAAAWKVQVRFENTIDRPYPIAVLGVDGYTDNTSNEKVFDGQNGVDNGTSVGRLAPGTNATVTFGFVGGDGPHKLAISSMDGSTTVTFTDDGSSR